MLAITAGLCEEFLLPRICFGGSHSSGIATLACGDTISILFGLAHCGQGPGGMISTLLAGLLFGSSRVTFESLVPAVFWHCSVDLIAGIAGPRCLVRANSSAENVWNAK